MALRAERTEDMVSRSLTTRRTGRRPGAFRVLAAVATVLASVLVAGGLLTLPVAAASTLSSASVLAADAADFVPTAGDLPPGFREESAEMVGGDLEPVLALRRTFAALDGGRRAMVAVSLAASPSDGQNALTDRVNQLVHHQGWRLIPDEAYGEIGYRGSGTTADGSPATTVLFRIQSVAAEVSVSGDGDTGGPDLLDTVARFVSDRIQDAPEAAADATGFAPPPPARLPGREPIVVSTPAPAARVVTAGATGAAVTGSSSGSPIPGDTIINLTVTGVDRPWLSNGAATRVLDGQEYLTVEVQIDVYGQTDVVMALSDFWVSTFDGRSWAPIVGRSPALPPGTIAFGGPARGWLTFLLPTDQPALQLSWRLRTSRALADQANLDQTLVVPIRAGAMASATVGTSAPPASVPVVPPRSAPSGPTGPAGPSAPTPAPSCPCGGTRLQ